MTKKYKNIFLSFIVVFFICLQSLYAQSSLINTVYFKTDSYTIEEKYKTILNKIAEKCNADTSFKMKIFAFSDKPGSEDYNEELSKKRAEAVYDYLNSRTHVDLTKIYYTWIGESYDAYDLHFPGAHIQKRCVDVWVQFYKK